jgi:hypothetical protein
MPKKSKKAQSANAGKKLDRWEALQREKKLMKLERQAGYSGQAIPGVRSRQYVSSLKAPWPRQDQLMDALIEMIGEEKADKWIAKIESGDDPVKYANTIHLWFLRFFGEKHVDNMSDVSEDESEVDEEEDGEWL